MSRARGPLTAGAAETIITPPVGTPAIGTIQRSTGVHDDLFARALVVCDGELRVAIVSADLIGMDFRLADEARRLIRERTGITTALVHCTHNHSSPFTIPWSVLGPRWPPGPRRAWHSALPSVLGGVVAQAAARMEPVTLRAGRAAVRLGTNRRLPSDGGIVMKPNPDGPVVPWVDVLAVNGAGGRPLAMLFSHAAHPVIIHGASRLTSAEFPGFASRRLKERLGADVVPIFGQAFAADINADPLRGGIDAAERAGEALADAALAALSAGEDLQTGPLSLAATHADLPLQALPSRAACLEVLEEAERRLARAYGRTDFADEELWDMQDAADAPVSTAASTAADDVQPMEGKAWWMKDTVLCLRDLLAKIDGRDERPLRFEARMLRLGDAWSVTSASHELVAEYQLRLDREAATSHRMFLAYTDGCESYVPLDRDFSLGGYEAGTFPDLGSASLRYTHRRALAPGCESRVMNCLRSLWRETSAAPGDGHRG
jgi:hypothetical protein